MTDRPLSDAEVEALVQAGRYVPDNPAAPAQPGPYFRWAYAPCVRIECAALNRYDARLPAPTRCPTCGHDSILRPTSRRLRAIDGDVCV